MFCNRISSPNPNQVWKQSIELSHQEIEIVITLLMSDQSIILQFFFIDWEVCKASISRDNK